MSAAIQQEARVRFPFGQVDHLAWAKRIIWRHEQGDKTVMMVQLNFARMALNIKKEET